MPIDWSSPLVLICLGMILGASALWIMLRVWGLLVKSAHAGNCSRPPAPEEVERSGDLETGDLVLREVKQVIPPVEPRVRPRPVPPTYYLWMNLTMREIEVARLVSFYKSNIEIAQELSISPHTVANHLQHIFFKLGVKSRVELASVVRDIVAYDEDGPT